MRVSLTLLSLLSPVLLFAAQSTRIEVESSYDGARTGEVVVVPYADVRAQLPDIRMYHFQVRDMATGQVIPSQVTNFDPDDRKALYNDLVFQHDFAKGEHKASFSVELSGAPVAPYETKVFARYVPERLDDFAFENDRIAHRVYGPGLDSPAAGKSRLHSSGVDVWMKRVPYPIVDRWYLKGHNAYHVDDGEGLDLYSVGPQRGCGGTGIFVNDEVIPSGNWVTQKVLANGPIRAVFELTYGPWQAGSVTVSETKRYTVDAGRNLHRVESTFEFTGADEITVAIGITRHHELQGVIKSDPTAGWLTVWENYSELKQLGLGCGVLVGGGTQVVGMTKDNDNVYLLAKVRSGVPLTYYLGAGTDATGLFPNASSWDDYVKDFAAREKSPLHAHVVSQ